MTTFYKSNDRLRVIKVTPVLNCFRWEVFNYSSVITSIYFNIEHWAFRPEDVHAEDLVCSEAEFLAIKDAVLYELNMMLLPVAKVSKEAIEI